MTAKTMKAAQANRFGTPTRGAVRADRHAVSDESETGK